MPQEFPQDHSPADSASKPVATPEGDNEFPPDAPLTPTPDNLQRTPAIDTNKL